jgi:hypothetical protein
MQKFFKSGAAFMMVALLCIAAGFISKSEVVFTIVGAFWLIMATIVRARYAKKPPPGDKS